MKVLLDIKDNEAMTFMEMLKTFTGVKAESISKRDVDLLVEIKHIKKAFKDLEKLKAGKLKARPASELLNEL